MELRAAYKQTEVGFIPKDWSLKGLGEISDLDAGLSKPKIVFGSGCPVVTVQDIYDGAIIDVSSLKRVVVTADEIQRYRLAKDDILIGNASVKRSGIGYANRFAGASEDVIFAKYAYRARNLRSVLPLFLHYILRAPFCRLWIISNSQTGTLTNLNKAAAKGIPIPVPGTLDEQRAIAVTLSDVDALLTKLDQLIAKKRDLKQAAMQQLLTGQTRLPGSSGQWIVRRLGDIANIKTGARNNEDKVEGGEYPFFVRSENVERINSYSHDCEAILVPGEGRIGDIFHYINGRFDVHQRVYAITQFKPEMSAKFVHLYMAMKFGVWAMQNTVKATVDSLRLPTFQNFEMLMPPTMDEQSAIATVLSDMDAELAALEARRDKTRALKHGMMQELLTGRIRLV